MYVMIHVLCVIHVAKYDAHCDIFITCLSYYLENRKKLIRPENRVLHPVYVRVVRASLLLLLLYICLHN